MGSYENFVYGFLLGTGAKTIDDIFDMYGKNSINKYVLELFKILLVIIFILTFLYKNYFVYFFLFNQWWPAIVLPDAFSGEPFWAVFSVLIIIFTTYNIITKFNTKPLKLILLYNIIFYIEWFSGFSTEVGEWVPYIKPLKKHFPTLYPYFFLENDVEISKKKMIFRILNVILCILMLWKGNNVIINYFNIEDIDFINILPITSWCILGYNLVSVINQINMIYFKDVKYKKIHNQVNGFCGINLQSENVNKEKKPKEKKKKEKKTKNTKNNDNDNNNDKGKISDNIKIITP